VWSQTVLSTRQLGNTSVPVVCLLNFPLPRANQIGTAKGMLNAPGVCSAGRVNARSGLDQG
jgi:hypothetical protein